MNTAAAAAQAINNQAAGGDTDASGQLTGGQGCSGEGLPQRRRRRETQGGRTQELDAGREDAEVGGVTQA